MAKTFEVISVSELQIQREIIGCMPEVIDDSLHPDVCQRLKLVALMIFIGLSYFMIYCVEL